MAFLYTINAMNSRTTPLYALILTLLFAWCFSAIHRSAHLFPVELSPMGTQSDGLEKDIALGHHAEEWSDGMHEWCDTCVHLSFLASWMDDSTPLTPLHLQEAMVTANAPIAIAQRITSQQPRAPPVWV